MQDRPSAPELLDALAELLFADVREWVPRERRFQILVAANLCAVVARELRAGDEPSLADARLFRSLLGDDRPEPAADEAEAEAREAAAELARAIRRGRARRRARGGGRRAARARAAQARCRTARLRRRGTDRRLSGSGSQRRLVAPGAPRVRLVVEAPEQRSVSSGSAHV